MKGKRREGDEQDREREEGDSERKVIDRREEDRVR